jgi:hypothetical protein
MKRQRRQVRAEYARCPFSRTSASRSNSFASSRKLWRGGSISHLASLTELLRLAAGNVAEVFGCGPRVVKLSKSSSAKSAVFREGQSMRGIVPSGSLSAIIGVWCSTGSSRPHSLSRCCKQPDHMSRHIDSFVHHSRPWRCRGWLRRKPGQRWRSASTWIDAVDYLAPLLSCKTAISGV